MLHKFRFQSSTCSSFLGGIGSIEVREFIDEHKLHALDVVRTAYDLSGGVDDAVLPLQFFLRENITQEDVDFLYRQGGVYLLGSPQSKTKEPYEIEYVYTHNGNFKVRDNELHLNFMRNQCILIRVGEAVGYYVYRKPFSSVSKLKITKNVPTYEVRVRQLTKDPILGCYTEEEKYTQRINSWVAENCSDIVREGGKYLNLPISFSEFYMIDPDNANIVYSDMIDIGLQTVSCYMYLSIDKETKECNVYV